MVDGLRCPGSLDTTERLACLLKRREQWQKLDFTEKVTVRVPTGITSWTVAAGMFAAVVGGDDPKSPSRLHISQLPLQADQTANDLASDDLAVRVASMAFDPSQDLVALLDAPVTRER